MRERLKKWLHADTVILAVAALLLVGFAVAELYPKMDDAALPGPLPERCLLLVLICLISYLGGALPPADRRPAPDRLAAGGVFHSVRLPAAFADADGRDAASGPSRLESVGLTKREYYMNGMSISVRSAAFGCICPVSGTGESISVT